MATLTSRRLAADVSEQAAVNVGGRARLPGLTRVHSFQDLEVAEIVDGGQHPGLLALGGATRRCRRPSASMDAADDTLEAIAIATVSATATLPCGLSPQETSSSKASAHCPNRLRP
jgi:hypothetical protein